MQIIDGEDLQLRAAEQWYRDLPLKAARGIVYDCNGKALAENRDVYTVYVRPNAVEDKEGVAATLAYHLGLDYETLLNRIKTAHVSEITVARRVETTIGERLRDLRLRGVYFTVDSARYYPESNLLAQVMGFTNIDNVGQNGIEGYYNKYLSGIDGMTLTSTDIRGKEVDGSITRYVPAIAGADIKLSVDAEIQAFAHSAVVSAKEEWQAKSASMLVMDCKTGAILASAITPEFNLNDIPRSDIDLLNALSKNTLLVDVYEPGSTFKVFTAAKAIEEKVVSDASSFYCPGYRVVDGQRIKCWKYIGHGSQHLDQGFKNSCNCVFMDLALKLGTDRLYEGLYDFGFGTKTGVDFYGESAGIMMNPSNVKPVDLARIGFGQAVAVTPLQLVTAFSAVVNGGTLYEPYYVSEISSDGKVIYNRNPKKKANVISESTSKKMSELLGLVVSEGSGRKAAVSGYAVGGKTGTAQKYAGGGIAQGKYVSSFIGFAPLDDPQYVVLMIVDEPSGYVYYGSLTASPYAGQVLEKICDYKGMNRMPYEEKRMVIMPELTGKSLSEAITEVREKGLQYELIGEGNEILSTVPAATTEIPEGDVILLRTCE